MSDDQIIAVVQAHKEGKRIEVRPNDGYSSWENCVVNKPQWNFEKCEYRVAPEPRKPREWIFARYNNESWLKFDPYKNKDPIGFEEIIRVREVLDERKDFDWSKV